MGRTELLVIVCVRIKGFGPIDLITEATGRVGRATVGGLTTVVTFLTIPPDPPIEVIAIVRVLGGGRTPSMDSSPVSKEFCRNGRLRFKKGTRHGCGDEFNSRCNLVVNVSGSTTPSIKP